MIRLAVAGAGAWGCNHIRTLSGLGGARLRWIVEPDAGRRAAAADLAPGARCTADAGEALADEALDALVVASPTPTHVPLARAALRAGKHVLVEKPLATTARDAWDLVRQARRRDRLLVVGHLLLYHPAVRRLRALLRQGRLGRPYYFSAQRSNLGRIRTDEGTLESLAPHDVSVMSYVLGTWPTAVAAHGATYVQPQWEDLVFLTLTFPGHVLGHVHLSWLDPKKVRRMSLVGARGEAVFDDMDPRGRLRLQQTRTPPGAASAAGEPGDPAASVGPSRVVNVPEREPLREELAAFVRSIRTGRPSATPGEDGARVVRVLEAAQRSLAEGGRVVPVRIR